MDKQTPRTPSTTIDTERAARPNWWTDQHTSTWDRVKEALRRDWEQTRSDLSSSSAVDLNQNIGDTVKQAAGTQPLPPPSTKTRPDDPQEAAKRVEKEIKSRGKAQEQVVAAQTDAAVVRVREKGEVASEVQSAREKISDVQRHADERIIAVQQKADAKIAEAQEKVTEKMPAARDWNQVEAAVRYGYGARTQYADSAGWDDQLEGRLRQEWSQFKGGGAWEDMRSHVRRGWDTATRNRSA
ncbi:MAG: hypothetical protein U0325_37050 [Polyangiales bacterium]